MYCQVCERTSAFVEYNGRPQARCPKCLSLERHRALWMHLESETNLLERPASLLHLSPAACLRERLGAVVFDYLPTEREDVQRLSFADATFDCVVCVHVLEHVPDDVAGLREIYRVLMPGGIALLIVPVDNMMTLTIGKPSSMGHLRTYGRDFGDRVRSVGFEATEVRMSGEILVEGLR